MEHIAPQDARESLEAARRAREVVADEVGLPRAYWWAMAGGWVALGFIGLGPWWLHTAATVAFVTGHGFLASHLLTGRRRTRALQVSAGVASRRIPLLVCVTLLGFVALFFTLALALEADGTQHPALWSAVIAAPIIGFGGPEILRALRRVFDA